MSKSVLKKVSDGIPFNTAAASFHPAIHEPNTLTSFVVPRVSENVEVKGSKKGTDSYW